jgi:hypothetical protein
MSSPEQFEAWLYYESKRVCKTQDIVIAYDDNGNSVIGDRKWVEKDYPNYKIVEFDS